MQKDVEHRGVDQLRNGQRFTGRCRSGQDENSGPDNSTDAKSGETPRTQRLRKTMAGFLRFRNQRVDAARPEQTHRLRCMNVFHAGDGNLHPLILFDANAPGEWERADLFGAEILELCVKLGGTITGEHGVGIEKINSMCVQFSPRERAAFFAVKKAFDPVGLLNPGKTIPTLNRCAEYGKLHVHGGAVPHSDIPRF